MGLLSKANLVDLNTRLAFSDFIINNNIKFFAIFEKLNQDYLIKNSLDELLFHKYLKVVSYKGEINLVIKPPFIYIIRKSILILQKKKN